MTRARLSLTGIYQKFEREASCKVPVTGRYSAGEIKQSHSTHRVNKTLQLAAVSYLTPSTAPNIKNLHSLSSEM